MLVWRPRRHAEAATRGVLLKKGVLKNFAIFTGKHLCCGLFLIKLQAFRPATFLNRDSNTGVSFLNIPKFLKAEAFIIAFIIEHLWWLLLVVYLGPCQTFCDSTFREDI